MEYIFEDDVGELGSEIEAYCQKCRTDGPHTVITRYEDEVRQVQCGTCGHVHVFKPARPEPVEEEIPDAAAGGPRRRQVKKLTWEEAIRAPASAKAKAYGFRDAYRQGDYLDHPKFGKGYVNEIVDDTKIEAIFKDGTRVLIHNRKDLAGTAATKVAARAPKAAVTNAPRPVAERGGKASAAAPAKPAKAPKPARPARAGAGRRRTAKTSARSAKPKRAAAKPKPRKPKRAARPARRPARSRPPRRR